MATIKAPQKIDVQSVPTTHLHPNPHNPRLLFDRLPLETLKQSIDKVGILVPLTVYMDSKRKHYVILDGQRRWICAGELKLPQVPINVVAEPTLVQNIVTMFQIHKLREDWELMPTALKLELLMNELKETREKKLAELTGLNQAVVLRCKKLLTFSKEYQDLMLVPDPNKRVKADFFIELYTLLIDKTVQTMPGYSKNKFILQMLDRYKEGDLKSVTDFRIVKQHVNNATKAGKTKEIHRRLHDFSENSKITIDHLAIKSASVSANARKMLADIQKMQVTIKDLEVEEYYGEEDLWKNLEELMELIRNKLISAQRRPK